MLKNYNVKLLIFSLIPFIVWLIPAFTGNVSIIPLTILFGIVFLVLCLSTAYKHKYARILALIALAIIVYVLYREALSNDMFGKLYPVGLTILSFYYLGLNYIMHIHR